MRFALNVPTIAAIIFSASFTFSQTPDKRIEDIERLLTETDVTVAASEKEGEYSPTYTVELAVNKVGVQYPAVGTYSHIAKFYYAFGDREKEPYASRLMKINVATRRSAMITTSEFLFNPAGQLVFGLVRTDGVEKRETRLYFTAGRLIKMTDNGKDVNIRLRPVVETANAFTRESARLVAMFNSALKEGL